MAFVEFRRHCKVYRMGEEVGGCRRRRHDAATSSAASSSCHEPLGGRARRRCSNMLGTAWTLLVERRIMLDNREISAFSRGAHVLPPLIRFVFEFTWHLVQNLTALGAMELAGPDLQAPARRGVRVTPLEEQVGHGPSPRQLCTGILRRRAAARGHRPRAPTSCCCAAEPTGALDYHTGKAILKLPGHVLRDGQDGGAHHAQLWRSPLASPDRVIRIRRPGGRRRGERGAPVSAETSVVAARR